MHIQCSERKANSGSHSYRQTPVAQSWCGTQGTLRRQPRFNSMDRKFFRKESNVGKVAVALGVVHAVTDDKAVRDF